MLRALKHFPQSYGIALNGVNPARGAPFFSASVERESAQNFSDDNVIEHRDANVEVIMMQWLPFLNS